MLYCIFLNDSDKVSYSYQSEAWLNKRLDKLCQDKSSNGCVIRTYQRWSILPFGTWFVWFGEDVSGNRIWEI